MSRPPRISRISRIVARWDAELVVHPDLTTHRWRALRRPARLRAAAGFTCSAVAIATAVGLLVLEADDRLARTLALGAVVAATLLAAVTVVGLINSRRHLDQRFPQWFSRRRAPGVRRVGGEFVRASASPR